MNTKFRVIVNSLVQMDLAKNNFTNRNRLPLVTLILRPLRKAANRLQTSSHMFSNPAHVKLTRAAFGSVHNISERYL